MTGAPHGNFADQPFDGAWGGPFRGSSARRSECDGYGFFVDLPRPPTFRRSQKRFPSARLSALLGTTQKHKQKKVAFTKGVKVPDKPNPSSSSHLFSLDALRARAASCNARAVAKGGGSSSRPVSLPRKAIDKEGGVQVRMVRKWSSATRNLAGGATPVLPGVQQPATPNGSMSFVSPVFGKRGLGGAKGVKKDAGSTGGARAGEAGRGGGAGVGGAQATSAASVALRRNQDMSGTAGSVVSADESVRFHTVSKVFNVQNKNDHVHSSEVRGRWVVGLG